MLQLIKMKSEFKVEYEHFCQELELIGFEAIAQMLRSWGWTNQRISQAITRTKQLLFMLRKLPNTQLIPDTDQDAVIHLMLEGSFAQVWQMILKDYQHESGFGTNEAEREVWLHLFQKTQSLLDNWFGKSASLPIPKRCALKLYRSA